MEKNSILIKNEHESNRFSARVMLISLGVLVLIYLLEYFRVFQSDIKNVTISFSVAAILMLIPIIAVFLLKLNSWWVKYLMVSVAALTVAIINLFMSKDVVILYIYAVAIASLYFSRRLSWYSVVFSKL